jgi:hypothetical protein
MPIVNIDEPESANISSNTEGKQKMKPQTGEGGLVAHIMTMVRENRRVRDRLYKPMWDKYERTFRGLYTGADRTREGERSRLVAPALAAAVESTAATIEDAIFSRERWFDTSDDVLDQERDDVEITHKLLEEDMDTAGVPDAIAKVVLNGCLYGTGIGKVNIIRREISHFNDQGKVEKEMRPLVTLDSIPPWEFVIDSQARDIESAYFVAHETNVPRNKVWSKIQDGTYRKVNIFGNTTSDTQNPAGQETPDGQRKSEMFDGSVFVTEYYGLVPAATLKGLTEVKPEDIQANGHVEVIATVANELSVLRVIVNPFALKDRPIVAYQHSVVPGKFWGRGVSEKGWNAQRALDAELRARMDALGLLTSPMMGADITRLPRNPDMRVRPGKVWLTRGRPSEVLEPVILGNIDPNTFNQSSEMERLVQVGTGAIESNAPLNTDRRNETASGISMIQSSALKRMRRTMWNIERQFLNPFIRKAMHRYAQFSPARYPKDVEFRIRGTMGIVAREFEQSNLTALLSVVPPDAKEYNLILQSIIELSNSPKRDELLAQIAEMNKPDPEQQKIEQEMQALQLESAREEVRKQKALNEETMWQIEKLKAETEQILKEIEFKDEEMTFQATNAATGAAKVKLGEKQDKTNRLKIESEERREKIRAKAKGTK